MVRLTTDSDPIAMTPESRNAIATGSPPMVINRRPR